MQENGRMNWLEQIHQMKNRDIRTIEQHWTKDDDSGKLFTGKKIGMCQLSRTCSVGLFYIENVEPFASLTNSIADSLRRWKAFVIP